MNLIRLTLALVMTTLISVSHATVIHIVDSSGSVSGAENVLVDGKLYDVSFLDGSCVTLYSGCNESGDFTFTSRHLANASGYALWNQVFIGKYDSDPRLTAGCNDTYGCRVYTPWSVADGQNINVSYFNNIIWSGLDGTSTWGNAAVIDRNYNSSGSQENHRVFAVWTATEVPEPSTLAIFALGLMALVSRRFKKQS